MYEAGKSDPIKNYKDVDKDFKFRHNMHIAWPIETAEMEGQNVELAEAARVTLYPDFGHFISKNIGKFIKLGMYSENFLKTRACCGGDVRQEFWTGGDASPHPLPLAVAPMWLKEAGAVTRQVL